MKIGEIDRNLAVETRLDIKGLRYRNALEEPFDIYGLYQPRETGVYRRMPEETAEQVSQGVLDLSAHTAGGRIRFRTDSPYVAVKAKLTGQCFMPHMPLTGSHGLDLYVYDGEADVFKGTFVPPVESPKDFESVLYVYNAGMNEITINLPLYSGISQLYIGLDEKAQVEHGRKYRSRKPILYYGSSITQGLRQQAGQPLPFGNRQREQCGFHLPGLFGGRKGRARDGGLSGRHRSQRVRLRL